MEQLMGKLNQFEDMIRKNERAKQVIEIKRLKETIKVLIMALRYERGVNAIIDYIDSLPNFVLKDSDIGRIMLFIDKKLNKEKKHD